MVVRHISEEQLQSRIVMWWDRNCARFGAQPSDLVHIPNGLMCAGARRRCLSLGVRPGMPDLMMLVPRGGYHGMFLELKRPGRDVAAGLSDDQMRVMRRLKLLGYLCFATNDYDQAVGLITDYMELL